MTNQPRERDGRFGTMPELSEQTCELTGPATAPPETTTIEVRAILRSEHLSGVEGAVLVTWATDCAERRLDLFEYEFPDDPRPRQAIESVRELTACPCDAHRASCEVAAKAAREASYLESGWDHGGHAYTYKSAALACAWAASTASTTALFQLDTIEADEPPYPSSVAQMSAITIGHAAGYGTSERTWQVDHLAELCGFSLSVADRELVYTMLNDGWGDSVVALFDIAPIVRS